MAEASVQRQSRCTSTGSGQVLSFAGRGQSQESWTHMLQTRTTRGQAPTLYHLFLATTNSLPLTPLGRFDLLHGPSNPSVPCLGS